MSKEIRFSNEGLHEFLREQKFETFTDIQEQIIPEIIKGKSVNVIAKTGSGKTLTFLLPVVDKVKDIEFHMGQDTTKEGAGKPKALILAPTRELALQIAKVTKGITHHAKLRVRTLFGGTGTKTKSIKHEFVDILVATPGRLAEAVKRKEINLKEVRYLILDEADQLLELGFKKSLSDIYLQCDPEILRIGLFSATFSDSLKSFIDSVFTQIEFYNFNFEDKNKLARSLRSFNIYLNDHEKLKMTEAFVKNEAKGLGIIFVNKHSTADQLLAHLVPLMPKTLFHALHGEMKAMDRKKSYDNFLKKGGILIATDIVARGMDVKDLNWVLNFDLPFEAVYYIHRCGRVGRQQKDGFVYNLVTPKDSAIVARINEAIKNQTALLLSSFDEKKFKTVKRVQEKKEVETKLDRKKKVLSELKAKINKKENKEKKHVKKVVHTKKMRVKKRV